MKPCVSNRMDDDLRMRAVPDGDDYVANGSKTLITNGGSADCLLQAEGKGMHMLMGDLPYERLLIALGGVAAMEGAIEETRKYVNQRRAFGQPVAAFQNTRFKLAECVTNARVARVFVDRCIEQLVRRELDAETAAMAA